MWHSCDFSIITVKGNYPGGFNVLNQLIVSVWYLEDPYLTLPTCSGLCYTYCNKFKIHTNIATKNPLGFIYVSPNIRCQGTSKVNISMTINCIVNSPIIPMLKSPESDVRLQFYIGNFLKTTRQVVTIFGLNHL